MYLMETLTSEPISAERIAAFCFGVSSSLLPKSVLSFPFWRVDTEVEIYERIHSDLKCGFRSGSVWALTNSALVGAMGG